MEVRVVADDPGGERRAVGPGVIEAAGRTESADVRLRSTCEKRGADERLQAALSTEVVDRGEELRLQLCPVGDAEPGSARGRRARRRWGSAELGPLRRPLHACRRDR